VPTTKVKYEQRLSKSKVVLGMQCEKALYLTIYKPELAGEVSDSQQMIFDQGHEVGVFAQKGFPKGVVVDAAYNQTKLALEQTKNAIKAGALSIFEATFEFQDVLVKVDILNRKNAKSNWEIIEVKSSTDVKDVHIKDAAIQLWVLRGAGLKVSKVLVQHINNQCVFPDLKNLFTDKDVTDECEDLHKEIPSIVSKFQKMLGKDEPKADIGPHCSDPYPCAFTEHCFGKCKIPEVSVFDIPRLSSDKKWQFYRDGKVELRKLDSSEFNASQKRMIEHTLANKRFVDPASIKKEISKWEYPLSFLDFETIAYAIPRFDGIRPYQQLPFQFSCHILKSQKSKLTHVEYLHLNNTDPREAIAKALVELVPEEGSVVAYNMGFEKMVLTGLADQFPKLAKKLRAIAARLVDPLTIFRAHVYDPKFAGSFSIKSVAPALLGKAASYDGMKVGGGTEAQSAFVEMIASSTSEEKRNDLKNGLLEYCKKDTFGMVELVGWLWENSVERR